MPLFQNDAILIMARHPCPVFCAAVLGSKNDENQALEDILEGLEGLLEALKSILEALTGIARAEIGTTAVAKPC
jgi:hypothetical protein